MQRRHEVELERIGQLIERCEKKAEAAAKQLEQIRFEASWDVWQAACQRANKIAETLAGALRQAEKAAVELKQHRDEADTARAQANELRPEGANLEWPQDADEAEWDAGLETLRELLEAGPRQPRAAEIAAVARVHRERERGERELVVWAVQQIAAIGNRAVLSQVPDHLHAEIEQRLAGARERHRQAQEAAAHEHREEILGRR